MTPSQAAELEQAIAALKEAERQKRLAGQEEARKREEERRAEARRKEVERQQTELRRKLDQSALGQQQAGQQLKKASDQQRQAELQKAARLSDEQLRRRAASQETCDSRIIAAYAIGADPDKVLCVASLTPGAQSAQPLKPVTPLTPQEKAWADQLDYLKRNAVRLQPEERKVLQPAPQQTPIQPMPSVTGFQQEITPDSELGRLLKAEAQKRERAREEEEARLSPERQAAYEQYRKASLKEQERQRSIENWSATHSTETEVDDRDCKGLVQLLSVARKTECAAKGQIGLACNSCRITKLCEKRFWGRNCEVQSVSCQRVCR